MARLNAFALTPRTILTESRELTDPSQPGQVWPLTLREASDVPSKLAIQSKAASYIEDYITGRNGGPPAPPPKVNGKPIELTSAFFQNIAALEVMQVPGETDGKPDEPYDLTFFFVASKELPEAFEEAVIWAGELVNRRQPTGDIVKDAETNP